MLRAFPCRTRLGDAESAATVEEEVTAGGALAGRGLRHPAGACSRPEQGLPWAADPRRPLMAPPSSLCPCLRSARTSSCGGWRWWAGTTATPSATPSPRCRTSTPRWITSSSCRAATTASSPAWPSSAVRAGPCGGAGCGAGDPALQHGELGTQLPAPGHRLAPWDLLGLSHWAAPEPQSGAPWCRASGCPPPPVTSGWGMDCNPMLLALLQTPSRGSRELQSRPWAGLRRVVTRPSVQLLVLSPHSTILSRQPRHGVQNLALLGHATS